MPHEVDRALEERPLDPRAIAALMLFLAPDSASWLTGVTLDVAGGYVII
jgi:NAD(P)-dependent dehydrogenase (short-subunit alcohol dehydrogenase family)